MPTLLRPVLLAVLLLQAFSGHTQPPAGYYNNAAGLNGTALKAALHNIIRNHNAVGYSNVFSHFDETDLRPDNGKIWDIYSDVPGGTPPYFYTYGSDQCGSYNSEGDCYNREHSWPQSYFNSDEPAESDFFQVYPTDGSVNGARGNEPYGETNSASYTSQNGSKRGSSSFGGFSGTVFEPLDSFKGDLARTYFYMATRYYTEDGSWNSWTMAYGADLTPYAISLLLSWHHLDPVSSKEINRNNAIYNIQNNRNPFIDNPGWADCIWGTASCSATAVAGAAQPDAAFIYPSPAHTVLHISMPKAPTGKGFISIINAVGQVIWRSLTTGSSAEVPVSQWPKGCYLVRIQSAAGISTQSVMVE